MGHLHTVRERTGRDTCTLLEDGQDGTLARYYRAHRTGTCTLLEDGKDGTLARYYRAHRTGHLHTVRQRTGRENCTLTHGGQGGTFALLQDEQNEISSHCYREDRKGHTHALIGRSGNQQLQYCGSYQF